MFRRRRGERQDDGDEAAEVEQSTVGATAEQAAAPGAAAEEAGGETPPDRTYGPFDASEVDLEDEELADGRLDLGALLVRPRPGMQIRIEVDQESQRIRAVSFLSERAGGLQLQALAAPRSSGIWADLRRELAADATRRGGTATTLDGPYGSELKVVVPAKTPDGRPATQTTRAVGVDGPRWMLLATFFGPAVERAQVGELDDLFRETVVVRGSEPMAPRDPLPLRLPPAMQQAAADARAREQQAES